MAAASDSGQENEELDSYIAHRRRRPIQYQQQQQQNNNKRRRWSRQKQRRRAVRRQNRLQSGRIRLHNGGKRGREMAATWVTAASSQVAQTGMR